jgi:hypothetical protein
MSVPRNTLFHGCHPRLPLTSPNSHRTIHKTGVPSFSLTAGTIYDHSHSYVTQNLVGGAITILKNMKLNGKDYPIYYGK